MPDTSEGHAPEGDVPRRVQSAGKHPEHSGHHLKAQSVAYPETPGHKGPSDTGRRGRLVRAARRRLASARWSENQQFSNTRARANAATLWPLDARRYSKRLAMAAQRLEASSLDLPGETGVILMALALSYRQRAAIYSGGTT